MQAVSLSVLLLLACLACDRELMCTAIGAEPGVSFDLKDVLTKHPLDVKVCVESTCVHRRASLSRWRSIFVEDQALTGPRVVTATVVIKRPGTGRTVMVNSRGFQLHKFQPNGPDCPPTVYQVALDVTADGLLQP